MKKIIMMVLIIATALSGITVPMRTAEAFVVTDDYTVGNFDEKIMELLGYTEHTYVGYCKACDDFFKSHCYVVSHTDKPREILWLSDKDGNVIIDDREIGLHTEYEIENTERYRGDRTAVITQRQSIHDNNNGYFDPVDVIEGFTVKLYCADLYDAKGSGNPYFDATWSSDNPNIAEVTQDGTVTAKKPGKAVIRAVVMENGKEVTREINVTKNEMIEEYKISKGRIKCTLYYDKKKNAVWKITVKNTGKKKYRYEGELYVGDYGVGHNSDSYCKELKTYKYKIVLKPGKSKTFKVKVKKLKKYRDLRAGDIVLSKLGGDAIRVK